MATAGTVVKRVVLIVVLVIVLLIAGVFAYLLYLRIPQSAAGWAAKAVCSGAFVAGRDPAAIFDEDVRGVSPAFGVVSVDVDEANRSVTGRALGLWTRTATLHPERGCVLDLPADPAAEPYVPSSNPAVWPAGDAPAPETDWPAGVDGAALTAAVDAAMVGAGDTAAANTRGVAVVQDGQLLVLREADTFEGVALHGWSMTKTVAGMLTWMRLQETGVSLDTPVVDSFRPGREPAWAEDWRGDERATITIGELFAMTDGLANVEGYTPFDATVAMLNVEPDMAAFAAAAPLEVTPGTRFNYTSQTSNILGAVAQGQFDTDEEYWAYPYQVMFDPIGATSATLETDTAGGWVSSSYLWATLADWARLGQLALQDGEWDGQAVMPPGWLEYASTPALPEGEGAGYSGQAWLPGNPIGGECRAEPGFPEDAVSMEGHWGQLVVAIPSRNAVIVRMGWTFDRSQFDACSFVAGIVDTLG